MRNTFLALPGPPVPEAILFATDSRISYSGGDTRDAGPKLFPLTSNSGVVYAGWVESGVKCIRSLQNHFHGRTIESPLEDMRQAELIVRNEHLSLLKERNIEGARLKLLIGIYDTQQNAAKLFRLVDDSTPPFKAEEIEGLHGIGRPQTVDVFKHEFEKFFDSQLGGPGGGVSDNPMQWLNFITIALMRVIETEVDRGVGGLVQTAIVGRNGFSWGGHGVIRPDDSEIATQRMDSRWRQINEKGHLIQETDISLDPATCILSKISD